MADSLRWNFVLILLAAAAHLLPGQANAAAGAFAVDDAAVGKPGDCKVESWTSFASNHDLIATASPACTVNLGIPVEISGQVTRQRSDSEWTTSAGIKGKANIIPEAQGQFGVGISGGTNWNTVTGTNTGGFINVPLTYQVNDALRVNINAGWQYDAVARIHYASWGAGFEWHFVQPLTLIGEVYGLAGQSTPEKTVTQPRAQIGLRLTPVESVDLDLIYGRNIAGENANWVTIGLNLRF